MLDEYIELLKEKLSNVRQADNTSILGEYSSGNGKVIVLKITLPKLFPVVLPKIFIQNIEELKIFIPHVEQNGFVCFSTENNILFDRTTPKTLVLASLMKAIETIESGVSKTNISDFRKEFVAFWDVQKYINPVSNFVRPDNSIKSIDVLSDGEHLIVCDKLDDGYIPDEIERFYPNKIQRISSIDALFIPLRDNNNVLPPNPRQGWSKKQLKAIITKNLSQSNKVFFNKWIQLKNSKNGKIILLSIPIEENNDIIIGVFLKTRNTSFKKFTGDITPLLVKRLDLEYLLERTSGDHSFINLNIALVGAGSVGSKVASELSKFGIRKMTIIDPDIFSVDNLYRHSLGVSSFHGKSKGIFKCEALAECLEKDSPFLTVEYEAMNVLDILEKEENYFDTFDYIFICIGDTMTSLQLNQLFSMRKYRAFYSWVEPLGIGGHSLYIDYSRQGCYECLYTDPITGNLIPNRASLAEEGQQFERNLASCRSAFIPYGSLTSSRGALEVVELFQKAVYKEVENGIKTWFGETSTFESKGYRFSQRYFSLNKINSYQSNFINNKCKICGVCHDHF